MERARRSSYSGKHLTLSDLWMKADRQSNQYLQKLSEWHRYQIPAYPRPELRLTLVSHSTDSYGLQGIRHDGGFRCPYPDPGSPKVVWFSLTATEDDLRDAETRAVSIVHPGDEEEPAGPIRGRGDDDEDDEDDEYDEYHEYDEYEDEYDDEEEGEEEEVLLPFASSPAFSSTSMYGSYRFTFDLQDILHRYSEQFCGGYRPVFRKWKTELYKQEVMYAVLVHSPAQNRRFSRLPLLDDAPNCICALRHGEHGPVFIWRPQAMCGTHRYTLDSSWFVGPVWPKQYFLWDHVTLALVVDDEVLSFGKRRLRSSLRFCDRAPRAVDPQIVFEDQTTARDTVRELWPNTRCLQRYDDSRLHIC